MNEYFDPPGYIIDFLSQAEGEPRLRAKLCMGGAWELGWGCTFHTDDRPVRAGETCDYDYAVELRKHALKKFADLVRSRLIIQVKEHQFWALVCLAYNIGPDNFAEANCTVLRETNAGNFANAVHAFERWTGASKDGPDRSNPNDDPADFIAPDGSPCGYFRRLRGLLRRHLGEACIFDGFFPDQATYKKGDDDPIAMTLCARDKRYWSPDKWRWEDLVLSYTPYKQVQSVARMYPLPAPELTLTQKAEPAPSVAPASAGQPVSDPQPQTPAAPASVKEPAKTSPDASVASKISPNVDTKPAPGPVSGLPGAGPAPLPKSPQGQVAAPVPSSAKPPEPVQIPPSVQVSTQSDMGPTTRTMWVSKRFWGGVLIIAGRLIIVADIGGHFAPAVKSFIGDGILMDWMTGVIVTMIGELVLDRGEKKATGPMDTPKRIALTTPTP